MNLDPTQRKVPVIPPREQRIRLLIDSDAKTELDDQWAISLAILSPERFDIEGFVGATYRKPDFGLNPVEASAQEIELVLEKAGFAGRWPVKRGSHPLQYSWAPTESEGVDFIIERAMAGSAENPLWIMGQGPATDIAAALLIEPRIVDRVVAFWHLRTQWPVRCTNPNVYADVRAARNLFSSPLSFVLCDAGTYLYCSPAESERMVKPYGALGAYLHEYRYTRPEQFMKEKTPFVGLASVAALIDPSPGAWDVTECPEVEWDLSYRFKGTLGSILRLYHVDRERTYALLYDRLRKYYG
jgi:inosine-uridine nucleoside N-ribohydrolase